MTAWVFRRISDHSIKNNESSFSYYTLLLDKNMIKSVILTNSMDFKLLFILRRYKISLFLRQVQNGLSYLTPRIVTLVNRLDLI